MSHSIPSASCEGLGQEAHKSIRAALSKHKVPGAVVAKVTQDGVSAIECFGVSDMATDADHAILDD